MCIHGVLHHDALGRHPGGKASGSNLKIRIQIQTAIQINKCEPNAMGDVLLLDLDLDMFPDLQRVTVGRVYLRISQSLDIEHPVGYEQAIVRHGRHVHTCVTLDGARNLEGRDGEEGELAKQCITVALAKLGVTSMNISKHRVHTT